MKIPFLEISGFTYLDGATTTPPIDNSIYCASTFNEGVVMKPNVDAHPHMANQYYNMVEDIATFIGTVPEHITFGKSTTELLNHVALQLIEQLEGGDEIVISDEEHNANYLPWKNYIDRCNSHVVLTILPLCEIEKYCKDNESVKVLSLAHTTNLMGKTRDIKKIKQNIPNDIILVVDGCQYVPHHDVDVIDLGVDFYVFSGHKMYSTKGTAVCYISDRLYLEPFLYGGGNITTDYQDNIEYIDDYRKHMAGTQDISGTYALWGAIEKRSGFPQEYKSLKKYMLDKIKDLPITVYNADVDGTTIVFKFDNIDDYTAMYDEESFTSNKVILRDGRHCTELTMKKYQLDECLRISFTNHNTKDDVDHCVEVMEKIIKANGGQ